MRSWMLLSVLLLLSVLIHEAQGIRLIKEKAPADRQHTSHNQNDKNKETTATEKENPTVDSSSASDQRHPSIPETYPGILDLAGMDYSQAKRKPPIHN